MLNVGTFLKTAGPSIRKFEGPAYSKILGILQADIS